MFGPSGGRFLTQQFAERIGERLTAVALADTSCATGAKPLPLRAPRSYTQFSCYASSAGPNQPSASTAATPEATQAAAQAATAPQKPGGRRQNGQQRKQERKRGHVWQHGQYKRRK